MKSSRASSELKTESDLTRLQRAKEDLDLIIKGGRWVVWSSVVRRSDNSLPWDWSFRSDFCQEIPPWLNVARDSNTDVGWLLAGTRLPEDTAACNTKADEALNSGATGYTQMFRIRLADDSISWIEENVSIRHCADGSRHLIGVCIDATARKLAEAQLHAMQQELVSQQNALIAQNRELHSLREKLEQEKLALAEANARLADLATTDGLTGIKNHRAFQEQLDSEWHSAVRYVKQLSLVMLDIDHFKAFNDTYGHPAGDEVLRQVGGILQENTRSADCTARYGGEEFAVILPHTDRDGAIQMAERFRSCIEAWPWNQRAITASVGVATVTLDGESPRTLLDAADRALYCAKASGRNRVYHYDVVANPEARARRQQRAA